MVENVCCKKNVMHGNIFSTSQCRNKAWRDGFCRVHHPDTQKARMNKINERITARMKLIELEERKKGSDQKCFELVLDIFSTNGSLDVTAIKRRAHALVKERSEIDRGYRAIRTKWEK